MLRRRWLAVPASALCRGVGLPLPAPLGVRGRPRRVRGVGLAGLAGQRLRAGPLGVLGGTALP
eukprot:411060-Alexandrium_andersonii.AAC.1